MPVSIEKVMQMLFQYTHNTPSRNETFTRRLPDWVYLYTTCNVLRRKTPDIVGGGPRINRA